MSHHLLPIDLDRNIDNPGAVMPLDPITICFGRPALNHLIYIWIHHKD